MRRIFLTILIIIILACLYQSVIYADEYYEILDYKVDMIVNKDNTYDLTEEITVNFFEKRHGIYRTIPITYKDLRIRVKNIDVNKMFRKEKTGNDLILKIGSQNLYVEGKQEYIIKYTYDVGDDGNKELDELYYNLIGTDWDAQIHAFSFNITMPKEFDESKANITMGKYGSLASSGIDYKISNNKIIGTSTRMLNPYEAVTIALPLPEGYYEDVPERLTFKDFEIVYYVFILLLLLAGYTYWFIKGRDNELFPSVEFYPPPNMTPSEVGYIIDDSADAKDIISLIIYWADKGYVRIIEDEVKQFIGTKKSYTIIKTSEISSEAKPYENKMFAVFFNKYGDGKIVKVDELKKKFYVAIKGLKRDLKDYFKKEETRLYDKKSIVASTIFRTASYIPIIYFVAGLLYSKMQIDLEFLIFGIFLSLFIYSPIIPIMNTFWYWKRTSLKRNLIKVLFVIAGFIFVLIFANSFLEDNIISQRFIFAYIASAILYVLSLLIKKRSQFGDKMLEHVLGFKEFLEKAEKDRIEALVEENPSYFYNVLPYTYVLGITDKWAKNFEPIALEPPSWYHSNTSFNGPTFNASVFTNEMNNVFSDMSKNMTSAPSSRGSSGGGFSGGGMGGGGGGSW